MISLKRDNLFIHKEGENDETPPDAVIDLSVLLILVGKTWVIQAMTMWSQQINTVPYYIWKIGAAAILDYWISVDVLVMLQYT